MRQNALPIPEIGFIMWSQEIKKSMNTKPKPSKEFIKTRVSACLNQMRIATDQEQVNAFKMEVKGWIETAAMAYGFQFADELQELIDSYKANGGTL